MSWDIGQVTRHTMRAGEKLRSECAHLRVFLRSTSTPRPATTRPATKGFRVFSLRHIQIRFAFFAALTLLQLRLPLAQAQLPVPGSQPLPPGQDPNAPKPDNSIRV